MAHNLINIFSTPLVIESKMYNIKDTELNYLKSLPLRKSENNSISENIFILENNNLSELTKMIDYYIKNYVSNVLEITNEVVRTQSWLAVSKKGQSHHQHEHPNTFISAVFYVDCKSGDLILKRQNSVIQDGFNFNYGIKQFNPSNCGKWTVPARTGDLVIFPGWVTHYTTENENDEDRIILGVNYFLKGTIGSEKSVDLLNI
jgi:uncharacterized protein (TIGR02466 family)